MSNTPLEPLDFRVAISDLATELAGGEVSVKLDHIAASLESIDISLTRIADRLDPPSAPSLWQRLLKLI